VTYTETLDFLYARLPMFHRIGPAAYKNSLENTLLIDEYFGHPHRNFKTVHVAGTNGKGSVSHMLAAVFQKAGYKTGLYTSPHLIDFRERIRVNGAMISEQEVTDWVEKYAIGENLWNIEPSFFELTVALAFDYFSSQKVDIAIIEVGLGGRLDSTNIITPEVSVITNIGYDHVQLLGDTLEKIAGEKAGIIKQGVPVVIGETHPETETVFRNLAQNVNAPVCFADGEYKTDYSMLSLDGKQILHVSKNKKQAFQD
jgi:dihydrofolate synthase/folylpolyglutamate synthase